MANNYQANNIKSLDYFEHIRKYPGMYIGSKDAKGLLHCCKEILSNSIDEWLNGAGSEINITFLPNNGICIIDNGRGIPHGKHESGCSTLQACFGVANTGGKFDNATGESGYNTSGGEHGTGGKAVNALSKKMIVKTRRDGLEEVVEFSKGQFVSYNTNKINNNLTGLYVEFYPDGEVFEETKFDVKAIKSMAREFSFLCKGLKFIITEENGTVEEFYSKNGLADYMNYLNSKSDFIAKPIYFDVEEGKFQLEIAIGYSNSYSSTIKLYTNNIPQEKGTHLTGFKTAWTTGLNNFARENKLLKDKDENLAGSDYEEGMILILNFKMIDPVFKGQNKEELSSSEGRTYCQKLTTQALKDISAYQKKNIKPIVEKAIMARKAREAARKAKEAVRNKEPKKKTVLEMPSKLADCNSSNRLECELYVTEGDSASGGAKTIRNAKTQAVLGLRGKVLNVLTADLEKIHKNAEIMDIIKALGLSWTPDGKQVVYDRSLLRYGKFIVAADRDSDGSHIQLLVLTCLWQLVPQLILDGYVYIALPPLYKAEWGTKYEYLQDKSALEDFKEKHTGNFTLSYFKGLGEADPEELGQMIMNPETRLLQKVTVEDVQEADKIIKDLMGKDSMPKKKFVFGNEIKEII